MLLTHGDMPTPIAGPGEVRVRLEASGVYPADFGRRAAGATLGIPGMTAWCCLFCDGPIAGQN